MNFFIDFEATQPENEIIAIGAVAENGQSFYSLVKPQFSKITPYVEGLIHISNEDLACASYIDTVLKDFDLWVMKQESNIMNCNFLSYGDDDKFLKATLPAIHTEHAFTVAAVLMAKIKDCTKETFKFFHGTISLIHAFNYIQSLECKQNHNPLEDAMMLQKVYDYVQSNKPLEEHPLHRDRVPNIPDNAKMPSGVFWCYKKGKRAKTAHVFENFDAVLDWLIDQHPEEQREKISRTRMMAKIMKAVRNGSMYKELIWKRDKERSIDEIKAEIFGNNN